MLVVAKLASFSQEHTPHSCKSQRSSNGCSVRWYVEGSSTSSTLAVCTHSSCSAKPSALSVSSAERPLFRVSSAMFDLRSFFAEVYCQVYCQIEVPGKGEEEEHL